MSATYPSGALTSICEQLLDEWELTPDQIANLANDIAGECDNIVQNRSEEAWANRSDPDDSAFRRDMFNAGRGHLLGCR